jgi:capsular exopolysaccharide synthesis family protein
MLAVGSEPTTNQCGLQTHFEGACSVFGSRTNLNRFLDPSFSVDEHRWLAGSPTSSSSWHVNVPSIGRRLRQTEKGTSVTHVDEVRPDQTPTGLKSMGSNLEINDAMVSPEGESQVLETPSDASALLHGDIARRSFVELIVERHHWIITVSVILGLALLIIFYDRDVLSDEPWLTGALVFGVAIAIWIEIRDRFFRPAHQSDETVRMPALAHLPRIERSEMRSVLSTGQTRLAPVLVSHHFPLSPASQRFHYLGLRILSMFEDRDGSVLQITSARHGEGTTTTTANLAISLAQTGRRVLVLDAAFDNPLLHAYFGLNRCDGLSEVCTESVELRDVIHECEEIPGLFVLSAGRRPMILRNPVHAPLLAEFLKELRIEFDCVLIDSLPVLESNEAIEIVPACDASILVVNPFESSHESAQTAADKLYANDAKLVGFVINNLGKEYFNHPSQTSGWASPSGSDANRPEQYVGDVEQAVG